MPKTNVSMRSFMNRKHTMYVPDIIILYVALFSSVLTLYGWSR